MQHLFLCLSFLMLHGKVRMLDALRLSNQDSLPADVWQDNANITFSGDVEFTVTGSSIKVFTPNTSRTTSAYPPFYHTSIHKLLVVPSRKFAFCYINKVACTEFNILFNYLNGMEEGPVYHRSTLDNFDLKAGEISKENGWYKGIFLREPTIRFLSAHKDKCERGQTRSEYCLGTAIDGTDPEGLRLQNFHASVEKLAHHSGDNPHYLPMTKFCGGLASDLADFDYVGHLSGSYQHVQDQVRAMLKGSGIEFDPSYEHLFPSEPPRHDEHNTQAAGDYNAYFGDPKYKRLVQAYYSEDYQLPGIERI